MQSRTTDLTTALRTLGLDVFITGQNYYKPEPSPENTNIKIRILDPRNTFPEIDLNSPYVKDSKRIVIRSWMTKTEILAKYGNEMSKKDVEQIKDHWEAQYDSSSYYIKHNSSDSTGLLMGDEVVIPGMPDTPSSRYFEYIPVYEVEWIEIDKDFMMDRYETIRIGDDIYILRGKSDNVIRSKDNPKHCTISVNGVYFLNRGSRPYSLVLACASLQD